MMSIRILFCSLLYTSLVGLFWPVTVTAQVEDGRYEHGAASGGAMTIYLPLVATARDETSVATFTAIPIHGAPTDRPAASHPDLNLVLRSYAPITATLTLIDVDGPADSAAPQLAALFRPARLPTFMAAYQVYDWDWRCGDNGCRGAPLVAPPVTLLTLAVTPGEPLFIPAHEPQIYSGGYKALVLYAEATRITLAYTREDTAAHGYVVHIEELQVDSALLALYLEKDAAGRQSLPALHSNERFATTSGATLSVAIRDTGSFMDPRTRKNWWVGY